GVPGVLDARRHWTTRALARRDERILRRTGGRDRLDGVLPASVPPREGDVRALTAAASVRAVRDASTQRGWASAATSDLSGSCAESIRTNALLGSRRR